jgi:hypothetical protein
MFGEHAEAVHGALKKGEKTQRLFQKGLAGRAQERHQHEKSDHPVNHARDRGQQLDDEGQRIGNPRRRDTRSGRSYAI